ncbi:MAG: hypothetical protein HQK69_07795, partial [Desulfamplus sp.]|nr:hypothetical protein [Desulfamplus sp.]
MINKNIPSHLESHIKSRVEELEKVIEEKKIILPLKYHSITEELNKVLLFSDFAASSLIKNPALLIDLIESGDLERSYFDDEYKLKIDEQIHNHLNKPINNIPINDNPLINDNVLIKFDDAALKEVLGIIREREMVRIAWQDIVEKVPLEQTLKDLSNLAEAFVDKVINFTYDKFCLTYGTPLDSQGNIQKPIVLGMGKLGAQELNFSSDIDLIFAYPEDLEFESNNVISSNETLLSNKKLSTINTTGEFFTKVYKNFLKVFDSSTIFSTTSNSNQCGSSCSSSMLFRVDTRLRPFGANGPIAMSFYTMEEYYQTQGRDWERYALIKARPIAGDIDAGYTLLKILNPFIYRRYFDYGSFDSLRDMKKRISLQVKDKRFKNNIKLGAGGIREIEFFGQVFQLIRGGVEPEFQERKILKILELLVHRNCIDAKTCEELTEAYCFLRKVEHRLQEYNDRQTHDLPEKDDEKLRLALSMGFGKNFNYSDSCNNKTDANCSDDKYLNAYCDDVIITAFYEVLNGYMSKVHEHN